jgi:nicotinate-nucleotide--dimethylbenzimidazole phosphoribosyltransferase
MSLLAQTVAAILPIDRQAARQAQAHLDTKTKPHGSLGRLEELACRLAAIYRTGLPPLPAQAVVVMAADHGVAEEGVSAYPAEVTAQMVRNFVAGGAAICVLARQAGAALRVVDLGTRGPRANLTGVLDHRLGPGTANFTRGPAMSKEQAAQALDIGISLADDLAREGLGLVGVGDMGIGNTTASSALTAALTGRPAAEVTGRGTGIDEAGWRRKVDVVERALTLHRPDSADPLGVLAQLGGFEIAGLTGLMLGAARHNLPVVLDGFITGAAALVAVRLCPVSRDYLIASHRSVEPGHAAVLDELGLRPLLDLDMRLGEGTGAVLAMHLVEASLRLLHEMATFTSAGVSEAGAM